MTELKLNKNDWFYLQIGYFGEKRCCYTSYEIEIRNDYKNKILSYDLITCLQRFDHLISGKHNKKLLHN